MIQPFQNQQVRDFIAQHLHDDELELILKFDSVGGVPISRIVDQIKGKNKAKLKLPTWFQSEHVIYPVGVNLEQCSSEKAAQIKVDFMRKNVAHTNRMVDITGGFGVDTFAFSKLFKEVH